MTYKDLIELDDAEMIDLGVVSLETEGNDGDSSESNGSGGYSPSPLGAN